MKGPYSSLLSAARKWEQDCERIDLFVENAHPTLMMGMTMDFDGLLERDDRRLIPSFDRSPFSRTNLGDVSVSLNFKFGDF